MKKAVPVIFAAVAVAILIMAVLPDRNESDFDVDRFAALPVLEGGRFKPIDSVARTTLLLFRGKQTALSPSGDRIPATEWMMRLTLQPESAASYPVFLIHHEDVKELIGSSNANQKHYSYAEIVPHARKLQELVQTIPQEPSLQNAGQREMLKLFNNLIIYQRLAFSYRVPLLKDSVQAEYGAFMQALKDAAKVVGEDSQADPDEPALAKVSSYLRTYSSLSDTRAIKFVPTDGTASGWLNLSESLMHAVQMGRIPELTLDFARLSDAYAAGNVEVFNATLEEIETHYASLGGGLPSDKVHAELVVNHLQPFGIAMALYVWVFVGVLVAWLTLDERLLKWVFWIVLLAFLVHTGGLLARMIIQGRPPVTNLYSSTIFVGWGAVALGVVLERIYKNGLGSAVSAMIGLMTLIVANHLMSSGDTMEMMRAVLDSNFWLATHVITISLGYSATYLAGFLAILYFVLGIFTTRLDDATSRSLVRMVYGILCFSLFFSFVGTVLGGIWADQSWGRFWGWDPKENGALMIVIWIALVLHAKRGGIVRTPGFMNLTIFGNVVTSWSWFGTNMLGVGLHSYGFMSAAFFWLVLFCASQVAIMLLGGLLPMRHWRSKASG